jgi:hypothetical protein
MIPIDAKFGPTGIALASGAIVAALLEALVQTGALKAADVRSLLEVAINSLGPRMQTKDGFEASQIIAACLRQFSENSI